MGRTGFCPVEWAGWAHDLILLIVPCNLVKEVFINPWFANEETEAGQSVLILLARFLALCLG